MSNQEVEITIRIKSELPVEEDAVAFAQILVQLLHPMRSWDNETYDFLKNARAVDVMKVEEEGHLAGHREDKPYTLEE